MRIKTYLPQECIPVGCVPSTAVAVCWMGGGVSVRGLSARWGVCPGGVCQTSPLWLEFLPHSCENITFPQLRLRTVNISNKLTLTSQQQ